MHQDVLAAIRFEVAEMGLMEGNQNGHNLTHAQCSLSAPLNQANGEQLFLPERKLTFAEIIDITEQCE